MSHYNHVLLTTAFSEKSSNINKKAFELAKSIGAKISILHVVEPLPGYGYGFVGFAEIETQLIEESKKRLAEIGEKYSIPAANQYIEVGTTKSIIPQKAEELNVDLIIVGSHDRHGLDYLLGSTANAIIQSAKCDVLTIRTTEV